MFQGTTEFKDAPKKPARMLQRTEAARVATSQRLVSMSMLLHDRLRDGSAEDWGGTNLAKLLKVLTARIYTASYSATTDYEVVSGAL